MLDLRKPTRKKKYKKIVSSRVLKILLFISVLVLGTTEISIAFSKKICYYPYFYALSYKRYRELRSFVYEEKLKMELLKLTPIVEEKLKMELLKFKLMVEENPIQSDNNNCNSCIRESYQVYESKCKTCSEGIFLQENVYTLYNPFLKHEIIHVIC